MTPKLLDAQLNKSSAAFRLMRAEEDLRRAEERVPPMAAIFSTWKVDLVNRGSRVGLAGAARSLPDHPAVEYVKLCRRHRDRAQQAYDAAVQALRELEAREEERKLQAQMEVVNAAPDGRDLLELLEDEEAWSTDDRPSMGDPFSLEF